VKAGSQKDWLSLIGLFVLCGWSASAAELRTWTFSQDGQMRTSAAGTMSFKKKGRLDAAFIRLETDNVVVLATRAGNLAIAATNLSEADLTYVARANRIGDCGGTWTEQSSMVKNEMSRRRREAAQLRGEAAAGRSSARAELEDADALEKEAARLEGTCVVPEIPPQAQAACAKAINNSPDNSSVAHGCVKARNAAAIAAGAADQLQQDIARLRHQAQDKREKAARLQKQAASLEETAQSEEENSVGWSVMAR
jgi:hypothetical protein